MNMETLIQNVNIDLIIPNRFQPRLSFDEKALKELASSIKEHGIIQPIVVRRLGDKYEIIAGERRYKAATMAGLNEVPVIISNLDDKQSSLVAVAENVQRKNLSSIEEAMAYKKILQKEKITQDELAQRLGISQSAVANKLRLLNLSIKVQNALLSEKISERHARSLLQIEDLTKQDEILEKVIKDRMTVKMLDEYIKSIIAPVNDENKTSEIKEEDFSEVDSQVKTDGSLATDNLDNFSKSDINISGYQDNLSKSNMFESSNIFDNQSVSLENGVSALNGVPSMENDLLKQDDENLNVSLNNNADNLLNDKDASLIDTLEGEEASPSAQIADNIEEDNSTSNDNSFSKLFNIFNSNNDFDSLEDEQTNMNTELGGEMFNPFANIEKQTEEDVKAELQSQLEEIKRDAEAKLKAKDDEKKIVINDLNSVKKAFNDLKFEIQKAGFAIDMEDFDFEDIYQLMIKIKKSEK